LVVQFQGLPKQIERAFYSDNSSPVTTANPLFKMKEESSHFNFVYSVTLPETKAAACFVLFCFVFWFYVILNKSLASFITVFLFLHRDLFRDKHKYFNTWLSMTTLYDDNMRNKLSFWSHFSKLKK
jgi:hypothetical protein